MSNQDFSKHPCFNAGAKGKFGRVHLPVAPKCNIKCNFCDRKYDCVNESRPGVTSTVLSPEQAGVYMDRVLEKEPRITVAGIAGPGDPFANGEKTIATMQNIRKKHPQMMLCVSSNGMNIGPYVDELARLEVSHVTITVCAVDPVIGSKIYSWVMDGNVVYKGVDGARLLLERQLEAITRLKAHNLTVKVNCIVIPTINDQHIEDVARKMKELGVDLFNAMAMFPNVNTPFAGLDQPDKEMMEDIRHKAEEYLPQMRHCTRCRADAVGLLDDDKTEEFRSCLTACATIKTEATAVRNRVAVATEEGILVNQHLGEAKIFHIWEKTAEGFQKVEERKAPATGGGIKRWHQLAKTLGDCRAVLVSGVGETPYAILKKSGVTPVSASGFIEEGLRIIFEKGKLTALRGRRNPCADGSCTGSGGGCG